MVLTAAAATGYGLGEITEGPERTALIARPDLRTRTLVPAQIAVSPGDGADHPAAAGEYDAYR